ncbi:myb-related transcription factor, partner of profilin-like [Pleurodeles waltl]|uniref:myb-related transcription factor, partner of profilin-like n=1 Tax=Pleurodeles waltl TaxID=8319 RepID=UPI0037093DF1
MANDGNGKDTRERRRQLKFSEWELEVLTEEVVRNHAQLFGKNSLQVPESEKRKLWTDIQTKISAVGVAQRTIKQIRKRWYDLQSHPMERVASKLKEARSTGGGPSTQTPSNPLEDIVESTLLPRSNVPAPDAAQTETGGNEESQPQSDTNNTESIIPAPPRCRARVEQPPDFSQDSDELEEDVQTPPSAGSEGQHVIKYLPKAVDQYGQPIDDVFLEVRLRLELRFAKTENVVMQRFMFYTQPQREGESVDEFVTRLRELSVKCRFGAMTEELIRDQLIVQCRSKKMQERLWAAKDPKLKDAIEIAKVVEESEFCMKQMERRKVKASEEVSSVQGDVAVTSKSSWERLSGSKNGKCNKCGSRYHTSESKNCLALGKEC